jgi:hypothetical protein
MIFVDVADLNDDLTRTAAKGSGNGWLKPAASTVGAHLVFAFR